MASLTWGIEESFYWVVSAGFPPAQTIDPRHTTVWQAGVASCVQGHLSPRNPVNGDVLHQRFWCSTLEEDNRDFVEVCHIYCQHKPKHQAPTGLLWPPPVPHQPWSHILKKLDHPPAFYTRNRNPPPNQWSRLSGWLRVLLSLGPSTPSGIDDACS